MKSGGRRKKHGGTHVPSFPVTEGGLKECCILVPSLLSKLEELQPSIKLNTAAEKESRSQSVAHTSKQTSGVPCSCGDSQPLGVPTYTVQNKPPFPPAAELARLEGSREDGQILEISGLVGTTKEITGVQGETGNEELAE